MPNADTTRDANRINLAKAPQVAPEIGRTYLSGNSMYPTRSTVVGIVSWDAVPAGCQRSHVTLGSQHGYDPTEGLYVLCLRGRSVGAVRWDVFVECFYESSADQVRSYQHFGRRPLAA